MKRVAGLDVHKDSVFVSIKRGQYQNEVKEFGTTTQELTELHHYLHGECVLKVAMESTGTYWQNLFSSLISYGFEVILVNGRQTKNIKGKKTDILDCQWIQKLHTLGLLSSSFLPDSTTDIIRTYSRHRHNIIKQSARTVMKIQKYLCI